MRERSIDALVVSVGSDLPYLYGYRAMENERPTMGVILRDDDALLIVPALEEPRVLPRPEVFSIVGWSETDDPIALVANQLGNAGLVAVGDQTWSRFTLALQQELAGVSLTSAGDLMAALRRIKEPGELERLRAAGAAVDRVSAQLAEHRFAGKPERTVAREIAEMTVDSGSDVATFTIVASGPNAASPHHEPCDRIIEHGDVVVVDFGGKVDGYCSDTTRTFVVGAPSAHQREVHAVVLEAQRTACEAVQPGVRCDDVDRAARRVIHDAGYGAHFMHRLGHGIGLDGHEDPYLVEGNAQTLAPGMTFSVEPGIYLPDQFGVRIEDIAACGASGIELFNDADRRLVSVE